MKSIMFYDKSKLSQREVTDNGYLKAPAYVARCGIYNYTGAELGLGSDEHSKIYKVYRPKAEVFKARALRSFSNLPVTNEHPKQMLNSRNTKNLGVGYSGDKVEADGDYVKTNLIITDKKTIDEIMDGKDEISLGYMADYVQAPKNKDYDFIQKNIKGNHIALVESGRAGHQCAIMDEDYLTIKAKEQNSMSKETNSMKEASVTPKTEKTQLDPKSGAAEGTKVTIQEMMQDEAITLDQKVTAMFDHFMDALESLKKPEKEDDKEEEKGSNKSKMKMDKKKSKDESSNQEEAKESDKEGSMDKKKDTKDSGDEIKALKGEIDALIAAIPTADALNKMAAEITDTKEKAMKYAPSLTLDTALNPDQIKSQVVRHIFVDENFEQRDEVYMSARFDGLKHMTKNSPNPMLQQITKATQDRAMDARTKAREDMIARKANAWKMKKA